MPKFATKSGFGHKKKGTKLRGVYATKSKNTNRQKIVIPFLQNR